MDNLVLITLTGGRSTPAVSGALALQPRAIEFINSQDEPHREEEIRGALKGLQGLQPTQPGILVDAYDHHAAYAACAEIVARQGDRRYAINLTAGTKPMALGAYRYALEHEVPAFYVVTARAQLVDMTTGHTLPALPMDISKYLACFRRELHRKEELEPTGIACRSKLAKYLVDQRTVALRVLDVIRSNGQGKDRRTCLVSRYAPTEEEQGVWDRLVAASLLAGTNHDDRGFRFTVPGNSAFEFLKGGWLETFVRDRAAEQLHKDGLLFKSICANFEIPSDAAGGRKEIDVGMMVAGQLIHCSCKAGGTGIWSTAHLDELRAVSDLIGGDYCTRVFITSLPPPRETEDAWKDYSTFLDQARGRKIVVIAGDRLADVGALLAGEALRPTYPRI